MHLQKFGEGNQQPSEFPSIPPFVRPSQEIMILLHVSHCRQVFHFLVYIFLSSVFILDIIF